MQMNNNTPHEKKQQLGLSWKELKKLSIEQLLYGYDPEFTYDPIQYSKAVDQASETLIPIPMVVLIGVN